MSVYNQKNTCKISPDLRWVPATQPTLFVGRNQDQMSQALAMENFDLKEPTLIGLNASICCLPVWLGVWAIEHPSHGGAVALCGDEIRGRAVICLCCALPHNICLLKAIFAS